MQTKSAATHTHTHTHPVPVMAVNSRRLHSDNETRLTVISHFIRWVGINAPNITIKYHEKYCIINYMKSKK